MQKKMQNLGLFLSRDAQKKLIGGSDGETRSACTNACEDDRGCLLGGKCAKGKDGCTHCYSQ